MAMAAQCIARLCGSRTHRTLVSVHALRAEKSAALLIFLYSKRGGFEEAGVAPAAWKPSAEKTETKRRPSILIGNVVSIGLIRGW